MPPLDCISIRASFVVEFPCLSDFDSIYVFNNVVEYPCSVYHIYKIVLFCSFLLFCAQISPFIVNFGSIERSLTDRGQVFCEFHLNMIFQIYKL